MEAHILCSFMGRNDLQICICSYKEIDLFCKSSVQYFLWDNVNRHVILLYFVFPVVVILDKIKDEVEDVFGTKVLHVS